MAEDDKEQRKTERRASKAARREKQRAQNILRAEKMHVAREAYAAKPQPEKQSPPEINTGCSGWFYWHWRDCFYSPDAQPKDWFDYYAKRFRTVELNAPFYGWPTVTTVQSWLRQAGKKNSFIRLR